MNQSLTFGDTPHETSIDWLKASEELAESAIREGIYHENHEVPFPASSIAYRISVYPLIAHQTATGLLWIASRKLLTPGVCRGMRGIADAIARGIQRLQDEETLRKQSAELAQLNIELKELADLKDRFVAVTSHEFRTPLTVILS